MLNLQPATHKGLIYWPPGSCPSITPTLLWLLAAIQKSVLGGFVPRRYKFPWEWKSEPTAHSAMEGVKGLCTQCSTAAGGIVFPRSMVQHSTGRGVPIRPVALGGTWPMLVWPTQFAAASCLQVGQCWCRQFKLCHRASKNGREKQPSSPHFHTNALAAPSSSTYFQYKVVA